MGKQIITPGVMAIVKNRDTSEYLLHKRTDNDLWSLPGGGAEFGESVKDALKREVLEECGIEIIQDGSRLVGVYTDPKSMMFTYADGNTVHSYSLIFECCTYSGQASLGDAIETSAVQWFSETDAIENLWPKLLPIFRNYLHNKDLHIQ